MAAVKTTQDYERAGREDAKSPDGPVRFKRSSTSWQAQAYWRGYEAMERENDARDRAAKIRINIEGTVTGRLRCVGGPILLSNTPKSSASVLQVWGPLYGPRKKPKNIKRRVAA